MLKNQSGRSMIEMLGVLAIIGVLSVGGIAGYTKAIFKHKVNKTIQQISYIATGVQTLFASQNDYVALSADASQNQSTRELLQKAKIFPDELKFGIVSLLDYNSNGYKNPFGIYMNILYSDLKTANDKKAFIITYDLPQDACVAVATQNWNSISGFIAMVVTFQTVPDLLKTIYPSNCQHGGNVVCAGNPPMTVEDAVTACSHRKDSLVRIKFQ